jgi:hypothetical protein
MEDLLMHPKHLVAAAAAVAIAGTAFGAPAVADDPSPKPLVSVLDRGLLTPLSLAVSDDGTVYYSENFKGTLLRKRPGKAPKTIYQASEGTEVGAVSVSDRGLRFATTFFPEEQPPERAFAKGEPFAAPAKAADGGPSAALMGIGRTGKVRKLADLWAFEKNRNPDGDVVYGLRGLPQDCEVDEDFQPYNGIVESHPYATTQVGRRTFIADAAGNDIVKYGRSGRLSTVAVLPAQPVTVTEEMAGMFGFPECAVGLKYYFEPVPTDVEKGPDGKLYVTTLPGGPEDPSLGARASVYRIDPKTAKTKKVASGLLSATGLAVGGNGTLFVSELFNGRIAKVKAGSTQPTTFLKTVLPGDVELRSNGDLYATTNVLSGLSGEEGDVPAGQVVRIRR